LSLLLLPIIGLRMHPHKKRPMEKAPAKRSIFRRANGLKPLVLIVLGVALLGVQLARVANGQFLYLNYWNETVYSPLAIALGLGVVVIAGWLFVRRRRRQR
jgi:LPXTG-motif cell wall-anchored protein